MCSRRDWTLLPTTDYWEIFQVQIWLVKFVFVDQSDLKLDPTAKHFSFWPRLGSFTSLRALGVIINKIASALTVRVEVSKACQTKLMKKSAYFFENTNVKSFQLFQKSRDTALCAKLISSFFKILVKLPNDKPVVWNFINVNDI